MMPVISDGSNLNARPRDSVQDDARQILIRHRITELAAAKIDAADAVAVDAVAVRALRVVQPRSVGDVGRRVFAGMPRRRTLRGHE
jgi:hypothetical protein